MTYRIGQRVRITRPDTRTQARTGDYGSIVSQGYNARGATYRVRLERAIDRSPRQTPEAGDYTFTPSQITLASDRGPREFIVGDRVALRNGSVSLLESGVTEPSGTTGIIHRLGAGWATSGSAAAVTVVLDSGQTRSLFADQIERATTPAPAADRPTAFAVGDRVRFIDGPAESGHRLAATGVTDPVGTIGVVTVAPSRPSGSYQVRVEGDTTGWRRGQGRDWDWNMYLDQMEPAPATTREIRVGDRVRLRNGAVTLDQHYITDAAGTEGTVTNTSENHPGSRYTVRTANDLWNCYIDQVELVETPAPAPAPAALPWVTATYENAVVGARIRYNNDRVTGTINLHDEGVIARGLVDGDSNIRIRMDNPRSGACLTGDGPDAYHWWVSLSDIEVQSTAPAPVETWTVLNQAGSTDAERRANIGRRVRYSGAGTRASLVNGSLGTIVNLDGRYYQIRMDDPRGQTLTGSGNTAFHWRSQGTDFELSSVVPTPAPETYQVVYNGATTTWTVGARLEFTDSANRESYPDAVVTTSLAYHRQERSAASTDDVPDWYGRYVFFEYTPRSGGSRRVTGLLPERVRQVESTPAAAPTAAAAAGVTFTPAQAALIKRTAERFTRSHGFSGMANDIMRELGVDQAPDSRTVSLNISVQVPLTMAEASTRFPDSAQTLVTGSIEARLAAVRSLFTDDVTVQEMQDSDIMVTARYGER